MPSIIQETKECFICKTKYGLQYHHVVFGAGKRQLSEREGLTVWLCREHHTGSNGVHLNHDLDLQLKQIVEKRWMEVNNKTEEDFIKIFGKNYLTIEK